MAYSGGGGVENADRGWIKTIRISNDGKTISEIEKLKHDSNTGKFNSLRRVDGDTYLLAFTGHSDDGWLNKFNVQLDGYSISKVQPRDQAKSWGHTTSLVELSPNHFALAYKGRRELNRTGSTYAARIKTFKIPNDGLTITPIEGLRHDVNFSRSDSWGCLLYTSPSPRDRG